MLLQELLAIMEAGNQYEFRYGTGTDVTKNAPIKFELKTNLPSVYQDLVKYTQNRRNDKPHEFTNDDVKSMVATLKDHFTGKKDTPIDHADFEVKKDGTDGLIVKFEFDDVTHPNNVKMIKGTFTLKKI